MLSSVAEGWLVLVFILALAGCANWQEFSKRVENPYPANVAAMARGSALYFSKGCPVCHGENGRGDGPEKAQLRFPPADFTNRNRMITRGDPDLFWAIVRGREKTKMPAYGKELSENEVWDLVNYLRSLYQ